MEFCVLSDLLWAFWSSRLSIDCLGESEVGLGICGSAVQFFRGNSCLTWMQCPTSGYRRSIWPKYTLVDVQVIVNAHI